MEIDMKIKRGQILKELRKEKGLNQIQLAKFIGVSVQAYQKYEYGTAEPTFDSVCKLADFYNVTADYLLGREPAPNPFSDLNLSEEDEANVVAKYMSLPPEIRACMLDVLVQLGDAAKKRQPEPDPDDTDYITVSTTLGKIEDRRKEDANSKDGA